MVARSQIKYDSCCRVEDLQACKVADGIRELSSPRLVQYASYLVRELTSPRDVQSASCPVRELAYPRVVQ